jgi:hypothetical protein
MMCTAVVRQLCVCVCVCANCGATLYCIAGVACMPVQAAQLPLSTLDLCALYYT